ncbi:LAETG motif-containing sortase-dependent surface protein [Streptomyces sp. NPDC020917]|uniref:LAETG motif-containing sortase-dependent surface protein n=1 Tax=Streptomyces sp. NPDC020917 TaxID=3365102 RepID=UPI0037AD9690
MSTNRRTAIAVRSIGVASAAAALALGVAGNAFACSIGEFTPSAGCDDSGHGYIQVVDKDYSQTPVNITVSTGGQSVGDKTGVVGSKEGVTVTFPVDWQPSTTYTVTVVKTSGGQVGTKDVTTPDKACSTPTTPTTPPASPSSPATPSTPATTAPSTPATTPSSTTSAPAVADTNAPSPAAGGSQNLAETGGGSNTGLIAGVAAALVAVGGGAVFALRRRNPAARH